MYDAETIERYLAQLKPALRIKTTTAYDVELSAMIEHVLNELNRVGASTDYSATNLQAIVCYAKAHFGLMDQAQKEKWLEAYNRILIGTVV